MITFSALKELLWAWVDGVDSAPVVWAEQNAPAPNGPYTTLRIASMIQIAQDYVGMQGETGARDVVGNREFTLEIQTFGTDAIQRAEAIRSSLELLSVQDALNAGGVAIVDSESVQNVSALEETRYEERASLDVLLRVAQIQTETIPWILEVNGDGRIKDATGTVKREPEIHVDVTSIP